MIKKMRKYIAILFMSIALVSVTTSCGGGGKAAGKFLQNSGKSASKVRPVRTNTSVKSTNRTRHHVVRDHTIKCSTCDGTGRTNVWNSYYQIYEKRPCLSCGGDGEKEIRY